MEKKNAPASGAKDTYTDITRLQAIQRGLSPIAHRKAYCTWRLEQSSGESKPRKVPYTRGGRRLTGSFSDSALQAELYTLEEAVSVVSERGPFDGIGLVFYPGCGYVGLDLDHVIVDGQPRFADTQKRAWNAVRAYAYLEVSQSRSGLHAVALGHAATMKANGAVEVFGDRNFLALTGLSAKGEAKELPHPSLDVLRETVQSARMTGQGNVPPSHLVIGDPRAGINADLIAHARPDLPPTTDADADAIRDGCAQVRAMAASGGRVAYEHWRGVAGILKHCADGDKLFHEWSGGHPSYSWTEAQAKLDSWQAGPTSCEHFERANPGACSGCKYAGKIRSPIMIGKHSSRAEVQGESVSEDAQGDIANGRAFASVARGRFSFNRTTKNWMHYADGAWSACQRGEEVQAAKHLAWHLLQVGNEAMRTQGSDDPRAKRMMQSAIRLQREQPLQAMLRLAASEPGMSAVATEFDADPLKLNCSNGVVDLRTGSLLAHDAAMMCSRQALASYRVDAASPKWQRFVLEVFGDSATVNSVQRFIGYSATGLVSEEKFVFAFGHGSNGKSVFANVIRSVLGTYCCTAPASMLEVQSNTGGARDDIARTAGARLIFANETNEGRAWDSQAIKTLVSTEVISARYLYGSFFEFQPTAKIIIRGNHKPRVQDSGDGMWRRIDLWPFERQFSEQERNPRLADELLEERDGILRWIVEGCLMWQRDGLKQSPQIRAASAAYRKECDLVQQWLEDCCTVSAEARCDRTALYSSFRQWAATCGLHAPSAQKFNRSMEERGFRVTASNGQRFFLGVRSGK